MLVGIPKDIEKLFLVLRKAVRSLINQLFNVLKYVCICYFLFLNEGHSMNRSEPQRVIAILSGPPGSGKGSYAGPLSEYLGVPHISSGNLFQAHIQNRTALGQVAKIFIEQGKLVPDELVLNMLFDRLSQPDCFEGCVLDGFPRTLAQAKALDQKLNGMSRVIVLHLNVSDAVLLERTAGRIICGNCKRPYHKIFAPPIQAEVCDICEGPLFTREDDQESIVRKRLEIYHAESQPLIDYYSSHKNNIFYDIDGDNTQERVLQSLLDVVPPHRALR